MMGIKMLYILGIIYLFSQVVINNCFKSEDNRLLYFEYPYTDELVIISAAMGEEWLFRIFPHLLIPDNIIIRYIISGPLFSLLHFIPYLTGAAKMSEVLNTVINTFSMGTFLFLSSNYATSLSWYIFCCIFHAINNLYFIWHINRNIYHNKGLSNGFVVKINH